MKNLFLCIVNINIFFSSFVFAEDTRNQKFRTKQAPIQIFNLHTMGKVTTPIKIIPHTGDAIIVKSNEPNNFTMTCIDSLENDIFSAKCTLVEKKINNELKNKLRQKKINVYRGKITITDVHNSQINITNNLENIDEENKTTLWKKIINWFQGQNDDIIDSDINVYVPMQFILQVTYETQLSLQINSSKENNTDVFFQSPSLVINKSNKYNEMIGSEDTLKKTIFIKGFFAAMQLIDFSSPSLTIYNFYPYCCYDITSIYPDSKISMHLVESVLTEDQNLNIIKNLELKRNDLVALFSDVKKIIHSSKIDAPKSDLEMIFQSKLSIFYNIFILDLNWNIKKESLDLIFLDQSNNVF